MGEGCLRKDTAIAEGKGMVSLSWAQKEGRQGIQARGIGVYVGPSDLSASESRGAGEKPGAAAQESSGLDWALTQGMPDCAPAQGPDH